MYISVNGGSMALRKELTAAAMFYGEILLHPRTLPKIELDIEVHRKYDTMGDCWEEETTKSPRAFTINLRNIPRGETLNGDNDPVKTLAHEMVHLKQLAYNELRTGVLALSKSGVKMTSKWHGEFWTPKRNECAYFDSPWEIEAYGREVGLYTRWVRHSYKQG